MSLDDFTEHRMPSGASCVYRERDHSYWESMQPARTTKPEDDWVGKGRLTGVTTCVAPFGWDGTNALMAWAVRMNLQGIAQLARRCWDEWCPGDEGLPPALDWLRDPEWIWRRLRDEALSDRDVTEQAGERGTNVHEHALNALAADQPVPELDRLSDEERGYARAVAQFWLDHDPVAMQAEQVVCDLGLRVAGRLDFRGRLEAECDDPGCPCHDLVGAMVLLDLKTSNFIGNTAFVQVAGYDHLARVSGYGASDALLVLKVKEEGTYTVIQSHATREDFLAALELYRRAAAINKRARADRKAREEVS